MPPREKRKPPSALQRRESQTTEMLPSRVPSHATVDEFRVVVLSGSDTGLVRASRSDRLVIGTQASADLVLHDRTVSRFHCEVVLEGGVPVVRDLGSRNGTLVDGIQVFHAPLRNGAELRVGGTVARFELGSGKVQIPLSDRDRFGSLRGSSVGMRAAFALLERAAANNATVLLLGETGTGKEAAAESIHRSGPRAAGPFVVVDCGAVPGNLLESELFGHEAGAFTGAVGSRQGAFEAAAGGTIFLDEVGELGLELQPKLLRALERREVKRVGGNKYVSVDVRIIAATNRNLRAEVNARSFRADLYYRLAVMEIRLPRLCERADDLPLLVEHFVDVLGARHRPEATVMRSDDFLAGLRRHTWPGNVRELRNYIERCLAFAAPPPIAPSRIDGDSAFDSTLPWKVARDRWSDAFARRYLDEVLARSGDNVSEAARAAGLARIYFHRLLRQYGVR